MHPSHVLLLAAGRGRRLGPISDALPKPLLSVAGAPILVRLMRQFASHGATKFTVVVGYRAEDVRAAAREAASGAAIQFIENVEYDSTNNAYSLWLARHVLAEGVVLAEADVVLEDRVMAAFLSAPGEDAWAVRPFGPGMDGALLEGEPGGFLSRLSIVRRGASAHSAGFKSMGLLRIGSRWGARFEGWLDAEISARRLERYYDEVVADHLREHAPLLANCPDGFWIEVDTAEDWALAERAFEKPA